MSRQFVGAGSDGQITSKAPDGRPLNLAEAAQRFINMRNECAPLLPKNMFRDVAWDLMLELFLAAETGYSPFIKQLQSIAEEPMANAMRRIDHLEECGLLADSDDAAHPFRSDRAHHSDMMPPRCGADRGPLFTCSFVVGQAAAAASCRRMDSPLSSSR